MRQNRTETPAGMAMDKRRKALGLKWSELAGQVGLSSETVRRIRYGAQNPQSGTKQALERALWWAPGGFDAATKGQQPRELDPSVAYMTMSDIPAVVNGATPDYGRQLRILRQMMGPAAFWRTVAAIELEDSK